MMKGEFGHRGETVPIQSLSFANAEASAETRDWLQSFAWLRDLAASSPRPEAARLAEPLTRLWLAEHAEFDPVGWRPDLIGWRILFWRSEEHTSELQSLMRISYAVFCLKKKKKASTTQEKL